MFHTIYQQTGNEVSKLQISFNDCSIRSDTVSISLNLYSSPLLTNPLNTSNVKLLFMLKELTVCVTSVKQPFHSYSEHSLSKHKHCQSHSVKRRLTSVLSNIFSSLQLQGGESIAKDSLTCQHACLSLGSLHRHSLMHLQLDCSSITARTNNSC